MFISEMKQYTKSFMNDVSKYHFIKLQNKKKNTINHNSWYKDIFK